MFVVFLLCTILSVQIEDPVLREVSGMVATKDALYVHNDSGDGPYLYTLNRDGQRVSVAQFANTQPIDVEAIAMDGSTIYIGDTGRNARGGPLYTVYRWPHGEPITFRFPQNEVLDIEAMLVINGMVMVIPKTTYATLWALENGVMREVGRLLDHRGEPIHFVTGATRDGDTVLIRKYSKLFMYDWSQGIQLRATKRLPMVGEVQGESVALLDGTYWTMSEYANLGYAFLHR